MRKVTTIQLYRAEGPIEETGRWLNFPTWAEANAQLARWARTAPDLGYDKIDFRVLYDKSTEDCYEGRFDLTPEHQTGGKLLQTHIKDFVLWFWGIHYRDRATGALIES